MSAVLEAVEAASDSGSTGPPIGHCAHPDDPSERTALCGEEILGVPAFGDRTADRTSIAAGAILGATVALALGSVGRVTRAIFTRR